MRSQIVAFSEVRMLDTIIRSHNTVHNIERNTRTYTFQDIQHFLR